MFTIVDQRIYVRFSLFHIFLDDIFIFIENSEVTRYTNNAMSGEEGGTPVK